MMAYRSTPHSSTGFTPNQMVFGRNITLPIQLVTGQTVTEDRQSPEEFVIEKQAYIAAIHDQARESLKKNAKYRKRYYDKDAKVVAFKKGDRVWMYDSSKKVGVCRKLSNHWLGPYLIKLLTWSTWSRHRLQKLPKQYMSIASSHTLAIRDHGG